MGFFKKVKTGSTPSGVGYIILNILRFCNIICLLSCLASSSVMLVKTFIISKFFFFDATSHIFTGLIAIFLTISETGLFRKYFVQNWPLLSIESGFVTLGIFMLALGTLILGNLNKEATSEDSLGTSFYQLLIASGIITCVFGLINIPVSYMFRDRQFNIPARKVRAYGKTAKDHMIESYTSGPGNRGMEQYNSDREKYLETGSQQSSHPPSAQQSFQDLRAQETGTAGENTNQNLSVPQRNVSNAASSRYEDVTYSEYGNPYTRVGTPLSRASSQRTRLPAPSWRTMPISQPYNIDPELTEKYKNQPDVQKPEAVHPAMRQGGYGGMGGMI